MASDTAKANTTATSGHVDNDDSKEQWRQAMATGDTVATSRHIDDDKSDKQDVHDDDQDEDKVDMMTTRQRATHQQ